MWISERDMRREQGEPAAELGVVTLGGDPAGVSLGGERRQLPVYSPGGVTWRPAAGDKVLVLKTGRRGSSPASLDGCSRGPGHWPRERCGWRHPAAEAAFWRAGMA